MDNIMEKAIALKQRLEELKNEQYKIENELYNLRSKVEPKAKYGNLEVIIEPNYTEFMTKEIFEAVRLVDYLLNKKEKDNHMKIFGQISGDWRETRGSVMYYRNEYGVLSHTGGGWMLMKDGIPCSNEEWEAIKQGNILDKFKNTKI